MMIDLEMIGEGATAKIYRDENIAIKLYKNSVITIIEEEARLQTYAMEAGLPVPAVHRVKKIDDTQIAFEMEYVDGKPLLHEKMDREERLEKIRSLVELQCEVHSKSANEFPKQRERLTWKIKQNKYIDEKVKDQLLRTLEELDTDTSQLCHGDFHPLNILFDGKKYWVIDWVDATGGNPLADACRTYIIFQQFISRMATTYLRYFCEIAKVSSEEVLAWLPIIIAARLSENMDDKARKMLMDLLQDVMKEN